MKNIKIKQILLAEERIKNTNFLIRFLFQFLAIISLGLAILGVILPGLPTTPFVILSAYLAMKSSPSLVKYLYFHKIFGPMLINWNNGGKVSRKTKLTALFTMIFCAILLLVFVQNIFLKIIPCLIMFFVFIWLWQRPEPKEKVLNFETKLKSVYE